MKPLLVIVLWALAGLYVGNLVERLTGIGLTTAVMAAFAVAGIYLAVRIAHTTTPASGPAIPSAESDGRFDGRGVA